MTENEEANCCEAYAKWPGWKASSLPWQAFKAGYEAALASHAPSGTLWKGQYQCCEPCLLEKGHIGPHFSHAPSGDAEHLAQKFHEAYERLAPQFGYETRKESAKPWADVPEQNKQLMIAVCRELASEAAAQPKFVRDSRSGELAEIEHNDH